MTKTVEVVVKLELKDGVKTAEFLKDMRRRMNAYMTKHAKTNHGVSIDVRTK